MGEITLAAFYLLLASLVPGPMSTCGDSDGSSKSEAELKLLSLEHSPLRGSAAALWKSAGRGNQPDGGLCSLHPSPQGVSMRVCIPPSQT